MKTSIAPFVQDEAGRFYATFERVAVYVFITELAQHTQNVLWMISVKPNREAESNQTGLVSCLLVEDERDTEQLFAR